MTLVRKPKKKEEGTEEGEEEGEKEGEREKASQPSSGHSGKCHEFFFLPGRTRPVLERTFKRKVRPRSDLGRMAS